MDSCLIFNYVHISNFFSDFFLVKNFHHSHFFYGKSFLMCQDSLTADYLITSFATLLERVYMYNLYRKSTIRDAGSTALYTAYTINTVVTVFTVFTIQTDLYCLKSSMYAYLCIVEKVKE